MSDRDALKQVLAITRKMRQLVPAQPSRPISPAPPIPNLQLASSIKDFESQLFGKGIQPQLSKIAISKALQLEAVYQQSFSAACCGLSQHNRTGLGKSPTENSYLLKTTFEKLFETKALPPLLLDIVKANDILCRSKGAGMSQQRKAFNYQSTPILEKFFIQNAYPSASDRSFLARETNMTPRQIEVWFQNHRNRAKKEGKPVRRDNTSTPFMDSTQVDQESIMKSTHSPEYKVIEKPAFHSHNNSTCLLHINTSPPHAFPTPYPPKCTDDPFPNRNGKFSFPSPIWPRTPSKQRHVFATSDSDIDNLATDFAEKLHFRSQTAFTSRRTRSVSPTTPDGPSPWFAATTVILPVAPLPALRRKQPCPQRTRKPSPFPLRRPCTAQSSAFLSWADSPKFPEHASRSSPIRIASSESRRSISSSSTDSSLTGYSYPSTTSSCSTSPCPSPTLPLSHGLDDADDKDKANTSTTLDINTLSSSLPELFRHYTPSFDFVFPLISLSALS